MKNDFDNFFSVMLIGDSKTGKTCLILRFADDSYRDMHNVSVTLEFHTRTIDISGKKIKLQIWDTAGQERFQAITSSYYRRVHGIIITYDITYKESFDNVDKWIDEIKRYASENVNILLVGNKADLESKRAVDTKTAKAFADKLGISFLEASAKTSTNVEQAFLIMAEQILQRMGPLQSQKNYNTKDILITTTPVNNNSKHCC